jgi:hypothetical protein
VAALADIEVLNFSEALPIEIAKITVMRRIECSVRKAALHNNYFLAFGDICIYEIVFRFTRQSITTAKAGVCWIDYASTNPILSFFARLHVFLDFRSSFLITRLISPYCEGF